MPIVPITLAMSAITAEAVSTPPAPGPSSVISRIASPCSMTALNAPSTFGQRMVAVDERRPDAHVDPAVDEPRGADQPDHHLELAGRGDVERVDLVDPDRLDVGELEARVEGDGREDRHLRRGVGAGDVVGRVGLGEAATLRLAQRLLVGLAALHLGQDEVGRAVDDPEHAVDVRDDERLAQHLDHRDRRADARLEPQLHAGARGGREELGARAGRRAACSRSRRACRCAAACST